MVRPEYPEKLLFLIFYLLGAAIPVHGTSCNTYGSVNKHCSSGYHCCGRRYNRYCCIDDDFYYGGMDGGTVAGTVVGCIVGMGLFIAMVVCLCAACNKSGTRGARIIHHNSAQPTVAIVNTSNMEGYVTSSFQTNSGTAYPQQGSAQTSTTLAFSGQFVQPPPYSVK
ncbi:uncharacterized protein LOC110456653 [Mizuhopecten yessoensis]|uniref:uncharacterized protein LOC110456653 n=1 Tax=Mizuhopecten yessoensis TaxID=6573 RepID=UPI000B4595B5|nr:uncharacterized protein LOC110456653 [Mizuhopecten yessoensis]